MTTMRTIITRAIRKTRARPLGDTPAAEEVEAALEDAQAFFLTLTSRELTDVLVTADYEAGEDERVTDVAGSYTITRPTEVTDVTTNQDRPPRNGAIIEVTGATPTRHIYVSELKAWSQIGGLALTSDFPFGPSLEDAMSDMLAVRFCDSIYQREPSASLVQMAVQGRTQFDARFAPMIRANIDPALQVRDFTSQALGIP